MTTAQKFNKGETKCTRTLLPLFLERGDKTLFQLLVQIKKTADPLIRRFQESLKQSFPPNIYPPLPSVCANPRQQNVYTVLASNERVDQDTTIPSFPSLPDKKEKKRKSTQLVLCGNARFLLKLWVPKKPFSHVSGERGCTLPESTS